MPRFGQSKSRRKEHQHLTPKISVGATRLPIRRPAVGDSTGAGFGPLRTLAPADAHLGAHLSSVLQADTCLCQLPQHAQARTQHKIDRGLVANMWGSEHMGIRLMSDEGKKRPRMGQDGQLKHTKCTLTLSCSICSRFEVSSRARRRLQSPRLYPQLPHPHRWPCDLWCVQELPCHLLHTRLTSLVNIPRLLDYTTTVGHH